MSASPAHATGLARGPSVPALRAGIAARVTVERLFVCCLIAAAFTGCLLWALVLPFNAAPDEVHHYNMDWYIAVHNQLPIFDRSADINHTTCQKPAGPCYASYASQPPGAPLLGAVLMKLAHLVTGEPYPTFQSLMSGVEPVDSLIFSARMASALCIAAYLIFLYLMSSAIFADRWPRLTAVALGGFIPQITFLGAYVNDDSMGLAAGAAVLYGAVRLLDRGLSRRAAVLTGLALAALALVKVDYYLIFAIFALAVLVRSDVEWRAGAARHFLSCVLIALGVAIALSFWWFARNGLLYGDPSGLIVWQRHIDALAPAYEANTIAGKGGSLITVLSDPIWRSWSFQSFWGEFDYMALPLPQSIYGLIKAGVAVCALGALVGVARYFRAARTIRAGDRWRAEVWALLTVLVVLAVIQSAWHTLTVAFQPQGRYLYPALIPVILFLTAGLHGFSKSDVYRRIAFALAFVSVIGLNAIALFTVVVPAYYHW